MCNPTLEPTPHGKDEWLLDTPDMRAFIAAVDTAREQHAEIAARMTAIRPHFAQLLANEHWLPAQFQEISSNSGMGNGIGMWLLYRAGDGSLAFSALVVPAGAQTPVHDHLAWGLVGLYRGLQDEVVYRRTDDGSRDGHAVLDAIEHNALTPGDFYELTAANDIHHVRTTSAFTSVSLHLLGNDNGCIWRHRFEPDAQRVAPFRSGWLNTACRES